MRRLHRMGKPAFMILSVLFLFHTHPVWAGSGDDSSGPSFSKPTSTFKASTDVQYFGTSGAQTIEHKNVTVDDTRAADDMVLPERTEFDMTNKITVLNNMGSSSSGKIYTSGDLESKTGEPVEKKGVVEIPYGESVRFTTGGMKILEKKKRPETGSFSGESGDLEAVGDEDSSGATDAPKGPRVLIS